MIFFFCSKCGKIFSSGQETGGDVSCPDCGTCRKNEAGTSFITELLPQDFRIGDCRIIKPLYGKNAVIAYLAEQSAIGRQVVLEVLDSSRPEGKTLLPEFLANARNSVKSRHPHIVSVLNAGRSGDLFYCIYPYFSGRKLTEILGTGKIYSPEAALALMRDIAEGMLSVWKKQGAFHGMLNPDNILITDEGDTILTDFWHTVQSRSLFADSYGDNISCLSPEHAAGGNLSFRSDIYALGVILYRMTTKCIPFKDVPVEKIKGALLLNRFFMSQEEIQQQKLLPQEFLHLIRRMCVTNLPDSIGSWEEYLAESEKIAQLLLTKNTGNFHSQQPPSGILKKTLSEISPVKGTPLTPLSPEKSFFSEERLRKYFLYIAILIFSGGVCAALTHFFKGENKTEKPYYAASTKPVKTKILSAGTEKPQKAPVQPKGVSANSGEMEKLQASSAKIQKERRPQNPEKLILQTPLFRQYIQDRTRLLYFLRKAEIRFFPGQKLCKLKKKPHDLLMQNRVLLYQHLEKLDSELQKVEQTYPASLLLKRHRSSIDNIRKMIDKCYADYDAERKLEAEKAAEKTAPKLEQRMVQEVEKEGKNISAEVVKNNNMKAETAQEEKTTHSNRENLSVAEYRKIYADLITAHCKYFMNSSFAIEQALTERERMEKYTFSPPAMLPSVDQKTAKKIRRKCNDMLSLLAETEHLADALYFYMGSSGEKYRNFKLTLEKKPGIIWRIKNNKVTFRLEKSPEAKVCTLQDLGRRNLALLAIHISEKSENMQKYCFPFLLKIHAYEQAEPYATSREEKLLLKILKTNFPAWVNNKTSLKLLKQELIHLPPEMVSGELRKQIADIQEELPSVQQQKKKPRPIQRRYNYSHSSGTGRPPASPVRNTYHRVQDMPENDYFQRKRVYIRRPGRTVRNREETIKRTGTYFP